ncbi:MAG: Hsp20/alpha crystallin family protein [Trueperaceae bacterium]|jgi:HSP20 family protein|nr:Hsp20/alpha crystallin family protein [Trueperaceae bacterium]
MALVRMQTPRTLTRDPMFDAVDRLFDLAQGAAAPAAAGPDVPTDLYETDEAWVLEMAVPGLAADDLDVALENRDLTVRADLPAHEGEDRRYWRRGLPRGTVSRTFRLPDGVDADAVAARVHDGLLTLTLPKAHEAKVKKIAIDAN